MSIRADELSVDWFSSSFSNDQGGNCVQGGRCNNGDMAVRDSKVPNGDAFRFQPAVWLPFIEHVKRAG